MRRKVLVGMLLICVTLLFLAVFISHVSAYTLYVPDSHSAIQEAVDAANAGDTIIVRGGTYVGDVYVNKSLTIRSESGAEKTLVYGSFIITSDHVKIRGFEIERYIVTPPIGFEKQGFDNIGEHTLPKILGNPPSYIEISENFVKQMIMVNGVCNTICNNSCN